jgi:spore coat polysaccharide biosynthesis protein SpsF (cytidylyltransferase family)
MTKTVALIQARMSSSRFPGKVLKTLGGLPLIVYMARRAAQARHVDEVIVVTSTDVSDDPLAEALQQASVPIFRGALADVLQRYAEAAQACSAETIVRLTGDCPLIDPDVIDAVITTRVHTSADYASNIDPPTFPDGLDVECFTREALERAQRQATRGPEREHVTLWMRDLASGLTRANHRAACDLSQLRLTVDYPDDLRAVRRIVAALHDRATFDLYDILRVLANHPDILAMNPHARNEGLASSLALEQEGGA